MMTFSEYIDAQQQQPGVRLDRDSINFLLANLQKRADAGAAPRKITPLLQMLLKGAGTVMPWERFVYICSLFKIDDEEMNTVAQRIDRTRR